MFHHEHIHSTADVPARPAGPGTWAFLRPLTALVLLGALPLSLAGVSPLPPSGHYLDASNYHVLSYNNQTGLLTDLGLSTVTPSASPHCGETTDPRALSSFDNPAQCGDCAYVPPNSWNLGAYMGGRCATSRVVDSFDFTGRVDIAVAGGPNEAWGYSVRGYAENSEWFDAEVLSGTTNAPGTGGCVQPTVALLGTQSRVLYYCSTRTPDGVPGAYSLPGGCERILWRWISTHPGSSATCDGNEGLWLRTSILTTRAEYASPTSGQTQIPRQYASACC